MLRLIPRTICEMFGVRYSKIILRYPFFVTLFIFLAPRPGCKWSRLPILPQNENYLSGSAVYPQSFYSPVSFRPGILFLSLVSPKRFVRFLRTISSTFFGSTVFGCPLFSWERFSRELSLSPEQFSAVPLPGNALSLY